MKIQSIVCYSIAVPLVAPFKTALRTVHTAHSVYVKVTTDNGCVGWGEAPPTHVITGDSLASITYAVEKVIGPQLIGRDIRNRLDIFEAIEKALKGNTSAKAAIDIAIHDLLGQLASMPLYELLGGNKRLWPTNFTVSVNEPSKMAEDAKGYVERGFTTLKVKVGRGSTDADIERVKAIRTKVGKSVRICLDANQGWQPKEAVRVITAMEDSGLSIEFVEQPVHAKDISGLRYVTEHTTTPIMADESVCTVHDALQVLQTRAADLINIKLMKCGGMHEALKISTLAESFGVECMMGSMIETKLGITAAAHVATSQKNIKRNDFDAPLMLESNPIRGGIDYENEKIHLTDKPGLGIEIDSLNLATYKASI